MAFSGRVAAIILATAIHTSVRGASPERYHASRRTCEVERHVDRRPLAAKGALQVHK
jgi:hypothetical protein